MVENCIEGYPSVQTYTVQSAFKYDFPEKTVLRGTEKIKKAKRGRALALEEAQGLELIRRFSSEYTRQVRAAAPLIGTLSKHVPKRRARKLHIGLFGYSRDVKGLKLPRAITFCATLYSIGLPPELLGVSALKEKDLDYLSEVYLGFPQDMAMALRYFNKNSLSLLPDELAGKLEKAAGMFEYEADEAHARVAEGIIQNLRRGDFEGLEEMVVQAAWKRHFLG
jgi:phosphoenolpyruvate carboxylase